MCVCVCVCVAWQSPSNYNKHKFPFRRIYSSYCPLIMNEESVGVRLEKQVNLRTDRRSALCIYVLTSFLNNVVTTGDFRLSPPCG